MVFSRLPKILRKSGKKITVYFIGYKAGLLESLPELLQTIIKKKINIQIICSSKNLESIQEAKSFCETEGRNLSVVASVLGTDKDPQGLKDQMDKLINAGVVVMDSNAQAVRMAALIATRGEVLKEFQGDVN